MKSQRPIIVDPDNLGGLPHIEGTGVTVAEVQEFWRQPNVGAVQARQRFPSLSEAELGAAVTWAEIVEPEHEFVAEWAGPPRRKLWIYGSVGNWMFVCSEMAEDGQLGDGWDVWENTFTSVIRYPESYASRSLVWRDAKSGAVVDIYALPFDQEV